MLFHAHGAQHAISYLPLLMDIVESRQYYAAKINTMYQKVMETLLAFDPPTIFHSLAVIGCQIKKGVMPLDKFCGKSINHSGFSTK